MLDIAIIGSGPTAIYTVKYLIELDTPVSITVYESQAEAGKGTPYHQDWNSDAMLANIASIEIPPLTETLVEWLSNQDDNSLNAMGLSKEDIDDRKFYPRIVLGQYFQNQLNKLRDKADSKGIGLTINVNSHVEDVDVNDNEISIILKDRSDKRVHSHVVMATGHTWPKQNEIRKGYFISPWPPAGLKTIGNCEVGILGTSLSAIDAMVTLAVARGAFRRDFSGVLHYLPEPGTEDFRVKLMSRKGLLPEADFYFPIPYKPLKFCTVENINELIHSNDQVTLLDSAFDLFKAELAEADPEYAKKINLTNLSLKEFSHEYFREREEHDPFVWAKMNLEESKRNVENKHVVEWRYAILRMHEIIARIVPHLSAEDYDRFSHDFKNIFIDDYATVPHESIERILALHEAGKLDILSIGTEYELNTKPPEGGVILTYEDSIIHFPAFIDATGQRKLSAQDFPFPSLWNKGIIKEATVPYKNNKIKQKPLEIGGIALDMAYHPVSDSPHTYRLYCPSIPFMLGQFPFVQGITSSHDIGKIITENLSKKNKGSSSKQTLSDKKNMKLFAVYVGGDIKGANIELHDMRFVVAETIEDTYEELQKQWWGSPESLHIDCWSELIQADGYRITLKPEPYNGSEKLYYVNLGGYDGKDFAEIHKNAFVIAVTESKAKVRALKSVRHWDAFHKDEMYQAEQAFSLNDQAEEHKLHIHLEKIEDENPAPFICYYKQIGKSIHIN